MEKNRNAEEFISRHPSWQELLEQLRQIFLESELEETIKWSIPVYTLGGKNVAGIAAFKNHAAIWFFQGALLKDEAGVLVNAQEGTTQAQRQWRFERSDTLDVELLKAYINEATENQRQGKVVKPVKKTLEMPPELSEALDRDDELMSAFKKLTPFKQREYANFISSAKRQDTKSRRLEKILPKIRNGVGLNDHYKC